MKTRWHDGHQVRLLENGEDFYPRVFEAIGQARREVIVETFILFEDAVGEALRDALVAAARAGASVDLTVDGYGSPTFSPAFLRTLADAGVRVHVFDRGGRCSACAPTCSGACIASWSSSTASAHSSAASTTRPTIWAISVRRPSRIIPSRSSGRSSPRSGRPRRR